MLFSKRPIPYRAFLALLILCCTLQGAVAAAGRLVYQINVYHFKTEVQREAIEGYLKDVLVPNLHKKGSKQVGVFKTLDTDTADRRIYVLMPFKSLKDLAAFNDMELKAMGTATGAYAAAAYNNPPYTRIETIVLNAFEKMPGLAAPKLTAPLNQRIYELRSYESATENLFVNKVHMFNAGDEVGLFNRLDFNAVFYASVIAGSRMPNLMYMTTFNSMAERDKHWAAFSADAYWKELSAKPEYQHNVSKADIIFLQPAAYSDL